MNTKMNKYFSCTPWIGRVLAVFLLASLHPGIIQGQASSQGHLRGTIVLTEKQGDSNVKLMSNVTIQLEKEGKILELKSDKLGDFSYELVDGKYCLKFVKDAEGNPLAISSGQHRCFRIRKNKTTRFDIILEPISEK